MEIGPGTRYTLWRNTASIIKIKFEVHLALSFLLNFKIDDFERTKSIIFLHIIVTALPKLFIHI